jgi:hypothetical protein
MKLAQLENPKKYVGLYVIDFGDHSGIGFTAQEVAEILDSEKFKEAKAYKIHRASPDGQLELKGVAKSSFQLEMGIFFYENTQTQSRQDFDKLVSNAVTTAPPCRAKLHIAKYSETKFVTAVIFPAEYNDEISSWLMDARFKTQGPANAGTDAVTQYYNDSPEILDRHQLFGKTELISRTGTELLANIKAAVQR